VELYFYAPYISSRNDSMVILQFLTAIVNTGIIWEHLGSGPLAFLQLKDDDNNDGDHDNENKYNISQQCLK
jgi:hypothetical protein